MQERIRQHASARAAAGAFLAALAVVTLAGCGEREWDGSITAGSNSGIYLGRSEGGYDADKITLNCTQNGDELTATFTGPEGTFTTTRPGPASDQEQVSGGTFTDSDGNSFTWTLVDDVQPGESQVEDGPRRVFEEEGEWGRAVVWGADGTSITVAGMHYAVNDDEAVHVRIKGASCAEVDAE